MNGFLLEDQKNDTLLYAGDLRVRITDWFFLQDKAVLKYVGLSDAVIKTNRKDSVWNYAFLDEYFESSSSDTTTKEKKPSGIQFDLKTIEMNNVHFINRDAWAGSDMEVMLGKLNLQAEEISISRKRVAISSIDLDRPYFSILNYKGNRPDTLDHSTSDTSRSTEPTWNFTFKDVQIKNGRFRNDKDSMVATVPYFDGEHIDFSQINAHLKNVGWANDTIKGNINISTRERSGLVVKSLKANTTIHPKAMIFEQFYLQTNRSELHDYFSMRYNDISAMDNFLHAVKMEANFNRATVSSDDIAFFAPDVSSWKKNIKIDGHIKGTVDALASQDLEVWAGTNTYIHGAVSLVGLPNIDETLINIDAKDLHTTYNDAAGFIPSIRSIETPNLRKLTNLKFVGTYTGFINDFVTYGTLQTNLGTLKTDLNMKFPGNGIPVYSGTISTEGFQLGSFINSPDLGLVDFHGTVKGKGFKWQRLDMNIDGIIHHIQYGDYTYQNITAKGTMSRQLFNGEVQMNDSNANMHLKGLVDLTGKIPVFNVNADIKYANLKALQISNDDLQLSGKFDLNLKASSFADMTGSARITNAQLLNNGKQLSFDSLVVSSEYENGLKTFRATSNEFDATLIGDYNLKALPDAFTLFLSRYYPTYIKAPKNVKPQTFAFDITTGIVDDYVRMIDKRLSGFNNSHISGSLNTSANTMNIDAEVPEFTFDNHYKFTEVELKGTGNLQKLILTGQSMNTQIGDSLIFPQTTFTIQAQKDISDVIINATANQAINQASLSAQIHTFSDGLTVLLNPSTFMLNSKLWTIDQGGELDFRKNSVPEGQVVLHESNQLLRLWTQPSSEGGNWNDLHLSIQNLNLGDITPLLIKSDEIEGLLSGDVVVEDPQNRFNVRASIHTDQLRVDNDSIGQVEAAAVYNNKTGLLNGSGNNLDLDHHIDFNLALNLKDSTESLKNKISLHPKNFPLTILNRFLNGIFSNIQGYVTGNLDILGSGDNTDYLAKASLKDASMKVDFTQVTYKIDDTEIELKKDTIDLNNIRIRDRFGNTALLKGFIRHKAFSDMEYDLSVKTESRQMELLNTSYKDNQEFYGRAMGSGQFVLIGPENDLLMNIDAKASNTDSSYITLPPSKTRESGSASFMVEKKYGREMVEIAEKGAASNLRYTVNLQANPLVNIVVILDEEIGDAIKARGSGLLTMESGTNTPLTINGRYTIDEGSYDYTFQSLFKRPFVLKKGVENYIEWTGDPYEANVHLDVVYHAEKVSFAPLASSLLASDVNVNSIRENVDVVVTLTGNLFHPTFNYALEFPSKNPVFNNPGIAFGLQQIEKNPNELYKQVASLAVFNSFAPVESATNNAGFNPLGELTYSTISSLLFGEVNKRLNQVLSKVLQNKLTFNFTGSLYNRNLIDQSSKGGTFKINQSDLNVSVGLPLINDRATFTIGGTFDVPLQADFQQTVRLFPDVTLQVMLNKTGSIRATFFYKENLDYLAGLTGTGPSTKRYGSSLSYNREFNSLKDFFTRRKPKKEKQDTTGTNGTK